jgi:hypothetical protein
LPEPIRNLTAVRTGSEVHLHWVMPKNTTDKVALKGYQRAHVCWISGAAPAPAAKPTAPSMPSSGLPHCQAAGDGSFAPDKPADFTAQLPANLEVGSPHVVSFFVELQNHAGKTAGPSNPGWIGAGAAPSPVTEFAAQTQAAGTVLRWQTAATQPGLVLRIHRDLVTKAGAPKPSESNGVLPPEQQILEVDLDKGDLGQALDRDAVLDHTWRYTAERVLKVNLDQHALEIAGPASASVILDAKDVFPPAVPAGLAVVVDDQAHALDLSWTADSDADIAGYIVYRRDVAASAAAERISGKAPVVPPSFEDNTVAPGHRYAYSVSSIDQDGNESARSPEVEEQLPQ